MMFAINDRPTNNFSWSDDDDWDIDHFNETYTSTVIASTMTMPERHEQEEEKDHEQKQASSIHLQQHEEPSNLSLPCEDYIAIPMPQSPARSLPPLPLSSSVEEPVTLPEYQDYNYQPQLYSVYSLPQHYYTTFAFGAPAPPAYKEMNAYHETSAVYEAQRVGYYACWRDEKVRSRMMAKGKTMLWRGSGLKVVMFCGEREETEKKKEKEEMNMDTNTEMEMEMEEEEEEAFSGKEENISSEATLSTLDDEDRGISASKSASASLSSSRPTTLDSEDAEMVCGAAAGHKIQEYASVVGIAPAAAFAAFKGAYHFAFPPASGDEEEEDEGSLWASLGVAGLCAAAATAAAAVTGASWIRRR